MKQEDTQSGSRDVGVASRPAGAASRRGSEADSIAAFQQRDACHLHKYSLEFPPTLEAEHVDQQRSLEAGAPITPPEVIINRASISSADYVTAAEHGMSPAERAGYFQSLDESRTLSTSDYAPTRSRLSRSFVPLSNTLSPPQPSLSRFSPKPPTASSLPRSSSSFLTPRSHPEHVQAVTKDDDAGVQILDIYEDDKLPGFKLRSRRSTGFRSIAVRVPRQVVGWKAVLMETTSFDTPGPQDSGETSKKAKRASKVYGKQGWEVRQEALKNSYDFRRGSGIYATMHAGHRLFKHDWHIIVKDGLRYMWRMDKQCLALYREDTDVKLAEFQKAVPSTVSQVEKRIGSFIFEGGQGNEGILDIGLALASFFAVMGARGGIKNVTAAFEQSSDPLRTVLEKRQKETPDREEVMLAMPRPGFARDAESILSDTTDEDAGEEMNTHPRCRRSPQASQSHSPRDIQDGHQSNVNVSREAPRKHGGRRRFSSFFGKEKEKVAEVDTSLSSGIEAREPMTEAQRIARQYRTQSMFAAH